MNLEERASVAMKKNKVTRVLCDSKNAVLKKIQEGQADALSVGETVQIGFEMVIMNHYAVRFDDRELGNAVRQAVMKGFGLASVPSASDIFGDDDVNF